VTFVVKINLTLTPSQNQLASHQSTWTLCSHLFIVCSQLDKLTLTPKPKPTWASHQSTCHYLLFVVNFDPNPNQFASHQSTLLFVSQL
jgi:hypothetical protein